MYIRIHTHMHTHTHIYIYLRQTNRYRNQMYAYQSGEEGKDKLGVQN